MQELVLGLDDRAPARGLLRRRRHGAVPGVQRCRLRLQLVHLQQLARARPLREQPVRLLALGFLSSVSAAGGARVAAEPADDDVTVDTVPGPGEAISLLTALDYFTWFLIPAIVILKTIYNNQVSSVV